MRELPPPRVAPCFLKAHGQGNDYLVFDEGAGPVLGAGLVRRICRRRRGIGADGIVVVGAEQPGRPPALRMFNPDGSEFERSGNGLRIAGVHLRLAGRAGAGAFAVETAAGRAELRVRGPDGGGAWDVRADLGPVSFPDGPPFVAPGAVGANGRAALALPPGTGRESVTAAPVSVGNPHAVLFADSWDDADVERLGPLVSAHGAFPEGVNVQFAVVTGPGEARIRIWERGVGRTASSGTSACAVVAAAVREGLIGAGPCRVEMEGGPMEVDWRPGGTVRLRGPVEVVCTGELEVQAMASRGRRPVGPQGAPVDSGARPMRARESAEAGGSGLDSPPRGVRRGGAD